jgi:hypothetical protein
MEKEENSIEVALHYIAEMPRVRCQSEHCACRLKKEQAAKKVF